MRFAADAVFLHMEAMAATASARLGMIAAELLLEVPAVENFPDILVENGDLTVDHLVLPVGSEHAMNLHAIEAHAYPGESAMYPAESADLRGPLVSAIVALRDFRNASMSILSLPWSGLRDL